MYIHLVYYWWCYSDPMWYVYTSGVLLVVLFYPVWCIRWKSTSPTASPLVLKQALTDMKLLSIVHKYFDKV